MEAKRATRNLTGIYHKYYAMNGAVNLMVNAHPDQWDLDTPGGRVKQAALAKRLSELGARLKELLGAVEETAALIAK